VDVEEGSPLRMHQQRRVAVQTGILHEDLEMASTGERNGLAILADEHLLRPIGSERLPHLRALELREDQAEVPLADRVEKSRIEVILVLVAQVDEARLRRVLQLVADEVRQL